jgi:hypothetical protein
VRVFFAVVSENDALIFFPIEIGVQNMGNFLDDILGNFKTQIAVYLMIEMTPDADRRKESDDSLCSVVHIKAGRVVRCWIDSVLVHFFWHGRISFILSTFSFAEVFQDCGEDSISSLILFLFLS